MSSAFNNSFRNSSKSPSPKDLEAGTQLLPQTQVPSNNNNENGICGIIRTYFEFLKNEAVVGERCTECQDCSCRFCKASNYLEKQGKIHLHFEEKMVDEDRQSVLHYAAKCENLRMGLFATAKTFLMGEKLNVEPSKLYNFANIRNIPNYTALHYALQKKNKDLISLLLRNYGDINLLCNRGRTQAANLVCTGVHKELTHLFDSHLNVTVDHINPSNELMWTVDYDFAPVVGAYDGFEKEHHQTKNLATWLRRSKTSSNHILLHPMMQIFLDSKGERFMMLRYMSIFYHVLFYVLWVSIAFCEAAAVNKSDLIARVKDLEGQENKDEDQEKEYNKWAGVLTSLKSKKRNMVCTDGIGAFIGTKTLATFFIINVVKELMEFLMCDERRYYFKQWQNIFQWLLYIPFLGLLFKHDQQLETMYYIISIFVAMALVQDQLAKIPILRINTEVFAKGLINVIRMGIAFVPFLTAFTITFHLLLPLYPQFGLFSFSKITTMLTGELNFDDIFYPEGDKSDKVTHPVLARFWFLVFAVVVVILFQNIVLATIIKDVQSLQSEAKSNELATRFDDIYLTEHFLMHPISQGLLSILCLKEAVIRLLNVERRHARNSGTRRGKCSGKRLDEFPRDLRDSIFEWYTNKKRLECVDNVNVEKESSKNTPTGSEALGKNDFVSSTGPIPRPRSNNKDT